MSDVIIKVESLTKTFKIYNRSKDRLKEALFFFTKKYHQEFHALKDISFEIRKGESIGILGKNGAGKSTLLKVLTGVMVPTEGIVTVNGRIAALLELGSGFNPELSGLDNIYFQGAIIGFTKSEMEKKIAGIVEFAEIGAFIDQPVKTYSSGMFARLAFSIAINVDPDILIVDEALSVGDMRFQQKCLRRMKEFSKKNKSIIFVSHDLNQIRAFCDKAIWIKDSQIYEFGETQSVCDHYFSWMEYSLPVMSKSTADKGAGEHKTSNGWMHVENNDSFGDGGALILSYLFNNKANRLDAFQPCGGDEVVLSLKIQINRKIISPGIGVMLRDRQGNNVVSLNNYVYSKSLGVWDKDTVQTGTISFVFPHLRNGEYSVTVAISDGDQENHTQEHWIHDMFIVKSFNAGLKYEIGNILVLEKDVDFGVKLED
jgi:ABC-type polysaccharide/polyol phosphate transport system ATPase subunit